MLWLWFTSYCYPNIWLFIWLPLTAGQQSPAYFKASQFTGKQVDELCRGQWLCYLFVVDAALLHPHSDQQKRRNTIITKNKAWRAQLQLLSWSKLNQNELHEMWMTDCFDNDDLLSLFYPWLIIGVKVRSGLVCLLWILPHFRSWEQFTCNRKCKNLWCFPIECRKTTIVPGSQISSKTGESIVMKLNSLNKNFSVK